METKQNNDFFSSRRGKKIVIGVIAAIGALLIFQAGIFVGYHKALFSYRGGERFVSMMQGPRMMQGYDDDFSPSHGAFGRIVSVALPSFVVASPNNTEQTVYVGNGTVIRMFRNTASTSDIQPERYAAVLGEPDPSGFIEARFIRIMPSQAVATSTAGSAAQK
ncbi:MAG TPA: hypothetical protein VFT82_00435 [Candidatus Paceibacterota bacterium]|nr:hypothetical protein [Candidatus Paceibacterota bacterium]